MVVYESNVHFVNCTLLVNGSGNDNITTPSNVQILVYIHFICGIIISLVAFVLNTAALVVFAKLQRQAGKRKAFHLIFIYLSIMEIFLIYGDLFNTLGELMTSSSEKSNDNIYSILHNDEQSFRKVKTFSSITAIKRFHYVFLTHDMLKHGFYWARNWWVALLALTRAILIRQRNKVIFEQVFTVFRVSIVFFTIVFIAFAIDLFNRWSRHNKIMLLFETVIHVCQKSNNSTDEWLVPKHSNNHTKEEKDQLRKFGNVRFTTSVTIPCLLMIASSIVIHRQLRQRRRSIGNSKQKPSVPLKMIYVFVVTFIALEMPRALLNYISPNIIVYEDLYDVLSILTYVNSSANVFIYYWNDDNFHSSFVSLFAPFSHLRLTQGKAKECGEISTNNVPEEFELTNRKENFNSEECSAMPVLVNSVD